MKQTLHRRIILITTAIFIFSFQQLHAQFSKGTIVVLRVGSDTGTSSLTSNAYPVFLDEFTTAGIPVKTFAVPVTGKGMLTLSGTATTEGQMTLAGDSTQLVIAGYNAPAGTIGVSHTSSKSVNRIIDVVKNNGKFVKASASDTFFSANTFRSAATDKGKDFWCAGSNTGTPYFGKDTPVVLQKFITNTRVVNAYKGQLYFSTASISGDSGIGVYQLGTGLPKTVGQNFIPVVLTGDGSIPAAFIFNKTQTVLYVANEDSTTGAIQKWKKSGNKWSLSKTFSTGSRSGTRGLCVDFSNAKYPTLYATATNNLVIKIKDSLSKPTATVIYTAPLHTIIRGIQFSPRAVKKTAGLFDGEEENNAAANNAKVISVTLYPNPAKSTVNITIAAETQQKYSLVITNVSGKVMLIKDGILNPGTNKFTANISSLQKGMYNAQIVTAEGKNSVQFEKE